MFAGFPPELVRFLGELGRNNTKAWFDAHRSDYEQFYLEPAKAFVEAVGPALTEVAPVRAEPRVNGSIFRINRDIRFSADKTPYKDHLDMWFWEGERSGAVSGLFLRITATDVVVGAGAHSFDRGRLARFRTRLADPAAAMALAATVETVEGAGHEIHGEHYKRLPAGVTAADPRVERFLLFDALWAAVEAPHPPDLHGSAVTERLVRWWAEVAPIHRWLVAQLG